MGHAYALKHKQQSKKTDDFTEHSTSKMDYDLE